MEERNVIVRSGSSTVGTVSLIALLIIAALIALAIWQPWNGSVMLHATSKTTSFDTTSGSR